MSAQKYLISSCVVGLALLTASFLIGLSAEATTPPVPDAFDGVSLPYDGPGSLWVLDDGDIVVQVRPEEKHASLGPDAVTLAVMSRIGADPQAIHPQQFRSLVTARTFLVPAVAEHSALIRKNGTWILLGEDAESKATAAAGAQFIPLHPSGQNQSGRQSVLDLVGELDITRDPKTGVYTVSGEDSNSGERFVTSFSFAVGEQLSDALLLVPGRTANCDNGDCSITCTPPVLPVSWCDQGGVPHCICGTIGPG